MSRARELTYVLRDSGAKVLLCLEQLYESVAREVLPATSVEWTLTTSELEYQSRYDKRLFGGLARMNFEATSDFAAVIEEHRGQAPPPMAFAADDVAFLTYTSGTTGVPKTAMNTHRNVVFATQVFRDWVGLADDPDASVWPREVEDVLAEHPAVREAAVVGVPDQYRGENVKAYVSLKPEMSVTPEELIGHCRERLAAYKCPRIVELIEELPKSASGKILRRELRDRVTPQSAASARS